MKKLGALGRGVQHRLFGRGLAGENFVQRQPIKAGHAPGQVDARKLHARFNSGQVSRISAKLPRSFYQEQTLTNSSVAKCTHNEKYIAPGAIVKSSAICARRETTRIVLAENTAMEQAHHIGWAIKQVIETQEISQLRLAEICDKDPATITRWLKHGKTIGSEYVKIIADFLGMKVSDLYKIAESGIFHEETEEDQRKARLKAMIDGLDPNQLRILFPEDPVDPKLRQSKTA